MNLSDRLIANYVVDDWNEDVAIVIGGDSVVPKGMPDDISDLTNTVEIRKGPDSESYFYQLTNGTDQFESTEANSLVLVGLESGWLTWDAVFNGKKYRVKEGFVTIRPVGTGTLPLVATAAEFQDFQDVVDDFEQNVGDFDTAVLAVQASEANASTSEANAAQSATNAGISETNASQSEINAGISEANASQSEINAGISEANASQSEINASNSEINAAQSALDAAQSQAIVDATNISASVTQAADSATAAANSASLAEAAAVIAGGGAGILAELTVTLSETTTTEDVEYQQVTDAIARAVTLNVKRLIVNVPDFFSSQQRFDVANGLEVYLIGTGTPGFAVFDSDAISISNGSFLFIDNIDVNKLLGGPSVPPVYEVEGNSRIEINNSDIGSLQSEVVVLKSGSTLRFNATNFSSEEETITAISGSSIYGTSGNITSTSSAAPITMLLDEQSNAVLGEPSGGQVIFLQPNSSFGTSIKCDHNSTVMGTAIVPASSSGLPLDPPANSTGNFQSRIITV